MTKPANTKELANYVEGGGVPGDLHWASADVFDSAGESADDSVDVDPGGFCLGLLEQRSRAVFPRPPAEHSDCLLCQVQHGPWSSGLKSNTCEEELMSGCTLLGVAVAT